MNHSYLENFSYIFIPFSVSGERAFSNFNLELSESDAWTPISDEIRYLHKFVFDRLVNDASQKQCYHYRLNQDYAEKSGVFLNKGWYSTSSKLYFGEPTLFRFLISDVQLFSFGTSVCILVLQIRFDSNDPRKVAAAQYYLRKITTEKIYALSDGQPEGCGCTFVDMARTFFLDQCDRYSFDFFFYSTAGNERANFLTYIDVPKKDCYEEDLFYLKWCYNDGFSYDASIDSEDCENYRTSADILWGISPSAAVCCVHRSEARKEFLEKTFQKNFQKQYLFTYILLLHQKYTMYFLLTKIGDCTDDLELLEDYKRRLYEFETVYVFSRITEVPQYQRLYDKVRKAFSLQEMFHDVQEPLISLAEIQRRNAEEEARRYDSRINTTLTILSLLTIVSSVTDAAGITSGLDWLINPVWSKIIQVLVLALVLGLSVYAIVRLMFLKQKR